MDDRAHIAELGRRLVDAERRVAAFEQQAVTWKGLCVTLAVLAVALLTFPFVLVVGAVLGGIGLVMRLLDRVFGAPEGELETR